MTRVPRPRVEVPRSVSDPGVSLWFGVFTEAPAVTGRVALIGFLCATLGFAAEGSLDATLARMDQAAATFRDLTADMSRTHHTAVINEDMVDSGTIRIKQAKPHELLMRFDIAQPDPRQVAVDSRRAEMYLPKSQTVEVYEIGKYKKLADLILLLGFGASSRELEASYTIRLAGDEVADNQKVTRLELTPKSDETHLKKVDLWISDATGLPVRQKLYWPGGDFDVATYTNVKTNQNLPDAALKLEVPKNVKREYPQK
jgi:outer membrane lipoprotein-sorting protein